MTDADPKKPTEDKAAADAEAAPAPAPAPDVAAATLEGDDLFDEFGKKEDAIDFGTIDPSSHPSSRFFSRVRVLLISSIALGGRGNRWEYQGIAETVLMHENGGKRRSQR